jgi:hypothetical protein
MLPEVMSSKNISNLITASIRERRDALSHKSFDDLTHLADLSSEQLNLNGTKVTISVWHDNLPSGDHRIVVQAYKPGFLGIGRMQADGFVVNARDEKRALTVEEWAPFA